MRIIQILASTSAVVAVPLASANGPGSAPVNINYLFEVVPPPGLVQDGAIVDKCGAWILATPGMTCYEVSKRIGVDLAFFKVLNPQLKGDCPHNFWAEYYYCTGLAKTA
ncbi:hypothetical protein F4861DRAFT_541906 [Xylaria intraflava]|nr:hypothetical protein F4861DRAFT_541906 [Xylaria intraflava]